jgi:exodeoxyribonuclease VII large subunit
MNIEPISVTDLNKYIKDKVAQDEYLNNVLVKGEISNFKHHYTGHLYFTLKDDNSLIKCIMFKSFTQNLKFVPKDGMKVMVFGTVSVFERDGVYQIYCKAMQEEGMGSLYKAYEELKLKLENEGLFSNEHKKPIPFMPKVVGVLTSQTGSVIRDIINVSTRRNPNVYIRLFPVPVQGEGAGQKIADAIKFMNENKLADVLILARGGGSLEDLWPFNEEVVARAIYDSELPVISAVGHETDFSISDFVADLRAPTPSAAAELAVADTAELKIKLDNYKTRYKLALKKKVELMRLQYEKCMARRVFKEPLQEINEKAIRLDMITKNMQNAIANKYKDSKNEMIKVVSKLDTLSPLKTLARGYSITR